jgi:Arc/MetJ family transcription regulator
MRTTIDIDNALMRHAMRATGLSSRKAVVEEGLRLIVKLHGQKAILRLSGKITWQGNLNTSRRGHTG